ncbi:MAG: MFS transporter [Candidatus Margulisiibacteriota bacterium]
MHWLPTFNRNLLCLLLVQALAGSTGPVLFLISGLKGVELAPTLVLSTLPMAAMIVGVAACSPVSTWIFSKIGRKKGHLAGLLLSLLGIGLLGVGLIKTQFSVFCLGNLVSGGGIAFTNQIRFTAAEQTNTEKALVHSWVLMFSLFSAIIGPGMTLYGQTLFTTDYLGSLLLLGLGLIVSGGLLLGITPTPPPRQSRGGETPLAVASPITTQPQFLLAALSGITAFATMTLLMSATPLQMHTLCHFSKPNTTFIIQSHIIAMFLPSLFSGLLLAKIGLKKLTLAGIFIFFASILCAFLSRQLPSYWIALVLLGIGWNFLYLAGSTRISVDFTGPERFKAQGLNDLLVFGTQAIASLGAGWLLFAVGWKTLVLLPLPLLGVLGVWSLVEKNPKSLGGHS